MPHFFKRTTTPTMPQGNAMLATGPWDRCPPLIPPLVPLDVIGGTILMVSALRRTFHALSLTGSIANGNSQSAIARSHSLTDMGGDDGAARG